MPSSVLLRFSPTYGRELDRSPGDPDLPNVANVRYRTNGLAPLAVYATAHSRLGWLAGIALMCCATAALADGVREVPPPEAPGVVASTDPAEVCGIVDGKTYSQRHRQTTPEMKATVRRRDGMAACGEIDHRLALALGGADDVRNLWCQPGPAQAEWSFKDKDRLEVHEWLAACRFHTKSLADAQAVFLAPDWRIGFCAAFPTDPRCPR